MVTPPSAEVPKMASKEGNWGRFETKKEQIKRVSQLKNADEHPPHP